MGVLGHQPERNHYRVSPTRVVDFCEELERAAKGRYALSDLLKAAEVLALNRAADVAVQDGDYRDEHAGGIGDRLESIAGALRSIDDIAGALRAIASSITSSGTFPGTDATGGTVHSLTEAVMGVTAAMVSSSQAASAISDAISGIGADIDRIADAAQYGPE